MAEVYRAMLRGAEGFERAVAIKRVLPGLSSDASFGEMFVREARLASQLNHPNIATVHDFDRDDDGCLFIVMELVDGKDLRSLSRSGELPIPIVTHVVAELLRALDYAHSLEHEGQPMRLVHRDVTPHNVLISWQGAVKLTDFGIARAFAESPLTNTGVVKGKAAYLSPEQARADGEIDGRSDLFAVGVILHELLSGDRLFGVSKGAPDMVVVRRVLKMDIPPLENVSPELQAVANRLLERDRDKRYPYAKAALEELLGCPEISARAPLDLAALMVSRFPQDAPSSSNPDRLFVPNKKPVGDFTGVVEPKKEKAKQTKMERPPRRVVPSEPTDADALLQTAVEAADPIPSADPSGETTNPSGPPTQQQPDPHDDIRATVRVDVESKLREMGLVPGEEAGPTIVKTEVDDPEDEDGAATLPPKKTQPMATANQPSTPPVPRRSNADQKWMIAIVVLMMIVVVLLVVLAVREPRNQTTPPPPSTSNNTQEVTPAVSPRATEVAAEPKPAPPPTTERPKKRRVTKRRPTPEEAPAESPPPPPPVSRAAVKAALKAVGADIRRLSAQLPEGEAEQIDREYLALATALKSARTDAAVQIIAERVDALSQRVARAAR